mgnify:FL=1
MALTKINGDQIATATTAQITALRFTTSSATNKPDFQLPSGTAATRPAAPVFGSIRYNSTDDAAEIYVADVGTGSAGWIAVGSGGPSVGNDGIIRTNATTLSENTSVGAGAPNNDAKFTNGFVVGPLTVDTGVTLNILSGARFAIL